MSTYRRFIALPLVLLTLGFAWSLVGCGNDDDDNNDEHDHSEHENGENEVHNGDDETQKMSINQHFMVQLVTTETFQQGQNAMAVNVTDRDGSHVHGATLEVTPWMPAHSRGSTRFPSIAEAGGGHYKVENIVFHMRGIWDLTVKVRANDVFDEAKFTFAIK